MPILNPFAIPNIEQSPYLRLVGGVGGQYGDLYGGASPMLRDASGNLISAGKAAIGPSEFDPAVASLLTTAANPVNNALEDYFRQKYMADVTGRLGTRGLLGQGPGEGMANDAERGYLASRADTALGRQTAAVGAANAVRTGQVGRAASLTGAGLSPYDTLSRLLQGEGNNYATAGELGNQVGIANARNRVASLPYAQNLWGGLAGAVLGGAKGAYDFFSAPPTSTPALRDQGLTSDMPNWSTASSEPAAPEITGGSNADWGGGWDSGGGAMAEGGRVGGRGAYDHVRALLTPKEFVVRRPIAVKPGVTPALKALNTGHFDAAVRKLAHVARVAR